MENQVVPLRGSSLSGAFRSLVVCLVSGLLIFAPHGARADTDLVQSGQITINPSSSPVILTLQGPATDEAAADDYGLVLSYHDSASNAATAVLQLLRPNGQYQWQFTTIDDANNSVPRLAMQLGNDHSLTLYDHSNGQVSIVLNPDPNNPQILINNSPVATIATLTSGSQVLSTPLLYLPETLGANTGVVYSGLARFIHSYGTDNLFVGANAGNFGLTTNSAVENFGLGAYALTNVTTGWNNSAIGANALRNLTTGNTNMAIGSNALVNNTTGVANLAIGDSAMGSNGPVTGGFNVAIGRGAGYYWSTGSSNVAIGFNAFGSSNGGWGQNIAIGNYSLFGAHGSLTENTGGGRGQQKLTKR